jgi:hypothetical protein
MISVGGNFCVPGDPLAHSAMGRGRQKAGADGRRPTCERPGVRTGRRPGGSPAHLVPPAPSVCYSLTCTRKRSISVVDSGLVADPVDYSAPDPPPNPNPPRSSPGWAHRGAPLRPLVTLAASALSAGSAHIKPTGSERDRPPPQVTADRTTGRAFPSDICASYAGRRRLRSSTTGRNSSR